MGKWEMCPTIHDSYVANEAEKLTAQGYRCIVIKKPIPDIIAIKGSSVTVLGVEIVRNTDIYVAKKKYAKVIGFDEVHFVKIRDNTPEITKKDNFIRRLDDRGRLTIPGSFGIKPGSVLEIKDLADGTFEIKVVWLND